MRRALALAVLALTAIPLVFAQPSQERERARPHVREAWAFMGREAWTEAAQAFRKAIDIDPEFEDAYYGLGLANMRMKKYGAAVVAYVKCRDLYRAQAGKQFTNKQDAQRYRRDRITEIDESIRQLQSGPQTATNQDRLRQLQEPRRAGSGTPASPPCSIPPHSRGSAAAPARPRDRAARPRRACRARRCPSRTRASPESPGAGARPAA